VGGELESNQIDDFDFEVWATLARENPDEFERRRRAAIAALIASSPANRRRLEGMQFRIDMERRLAHSPLKACLRVSAMMWDTFLELRTELAELGTIADAPQRAHLALVQPDCPDSATAHEAELPPPSATVFSFAPRTTGGGKD
jgi:hypothetical protein